MVSYNVIVGDTITKVVARLFMTSNDSSFLVSREFILLVSTALVTLPLSLYR